jgi:serine/threonine protein kinase
MNTVKILTRFECNNCNTNIFIEKLSLINKIIDSISFINIRGEKMILNNLEFNNVKFKGGKLSNSIFTDCIFTNTHFEYINLENTKFINCNINNVLITHSNANKVDFTNSRIFMTNFNYSNMVDSLFINSNIDDLIVADTDLSTSDFKYAIINNFRYENYDIESTPSSVENGYTFIKLLGEGSFGQVWKAKSSNDELVAIKCFKNDIDDMKSEYDALIDISGPECSEYAVCYRDKYIIKKLFEFKNNNHIPIIISNSPRLVIDYIDGNTADSIMNSSIDLNDNYLFPYCLIKGIDVLHKLGVSHQDIKLQNIMFDNNTGKFRYIDWGLACLKKYCPDNGICTNNNCKASGTVSTMPPELQEGYLNELSFKDTQVHDYWSIGVSILNFYRLSSWEEELYQYNSQVKIEEYLNNLQKQNPRVFTNELMNIVSYLLEIDPKKRYNNFQKVLLLVNEFKPNTLNPDIFKSSLQVKLFTFKTSKGDKQYTLDYLQKNGSIIKLFDNQIESELRLNGTVYKITPELAKLLIKND